VNADSLSPSAMIFAPVYHPSSGSAAQAAVVTVGAGDDRRGTDILLALFPMTTIEGVVIGATGQPEPNVAIAISTPGPPLPSAAGMFPMAPLPGADGRFRIPGVAPGSWTITARSSARVIRRNEQGGLISSSGSANELPTGTFYWGATTVEASGGATDVTIRLRPGLTMTGRVAFESASPARVATTAQVSLAMTPDPDPVRSASALFPASPPASATTAADGTFEVRGLTPGTWLFSATAPGAAGTGGWWLRSAVVDGRDLLDAPIELSDHDLAGVVVTLSDRHTAIAGTISGADGRPVADLAVIVLPEDRALRSSARRVQHARPDTAGRFSFTDLPPGTYLLSAATSIDPASWRTDEFLSTVASAGIKVTIGEGQTIRQDLKVGR
jgi:hypothetical protein